MKKILLLILIGLAYSGTTPDIYRPMTKKDKMVIKQKTDEINKMLEEDRFREVRKKLMEIDSIIRVRYGKG